MLRQRTLLGLGCAFGVLTIATVMLPFLGGDANCRAQDAPAATAKGPQLGANTSLGGKQIFPPDNPWNTDISNEPVDINSDVYINSMGGAQGKLHPDFGTVWEGAPIGIPYVVVPGDQPRVPVSFDYAAESDPGPYPIPPNPPIEGAGKEGDRHILIIDRDNWMLYELYLARMENGRWHAGSGAIFDMKTSALRPAGWTSADAAGLPILPGLVRYDEVMEQKEIRHALRFTVKHTRRAYVFPARHWASNSNNTTWPPMGLRLRLKADYDISTFPPATQVILKALKKYGMILADNGSNWFLSGAPDPRWSDEALGTLKRIKGTDFEVVKPTGLVTAQQR